MSYKKEIKLLKRLKEIREVDFKELLHNLSIDTTLLPGENASQTERAIELIRLLRQKSIALTKLEKALDKVSRLINIFNSREHYKEVQESIYSDRKIIDELISGTDREDTIKNNYILLGEGGMGKTTYLLKLWEKLLVNYKEKSPGVNSRITPIPVFLMLEKYNQLYEKMNKNQRQEVIWHLISQEYRGSFLSAYELKNLKKHLKDSQSNITELSIVLLLDGYNEVTVEKKELILCLKEIASFKNIQTIITSRYDIRPDPYWRSFETLKLRPLEYKHIKSFMDTRKIRFSEDLLNSIPQLRNPMMLTLYCNVEEELKATLEEEKLRTVRERDEFKTAQEEEEYNFILTPQYKAEIIHNYIVSSISRLDRQEEDKKFLHRLHLKFLLPVIAYEMEKKGLFEIKYEDLINIIAEEFKRYTGIKFIKKYPELTEYMNKDVMSFIEPANSWNIIYTIRLLRDKYNFLQKFGKNTYSFLHQYFRDYFAAIYLKDKILQGINSKNSSFTELSSRVLQNHLIKMLGELTGEPRRKPVIEGNYRNSEFKNTIFDKALDLLRNKEMKEGDYRILNILEILKSQRLDLSNTDLSYLDLYRVVLNNVRLGYGKIDEKCRAATLKGSKIKAWNFFSHGHKLPVKIIRYSPDGKKFISGSEDRTIKEWDVNTGECIKVYTGHKDNISSLCYNSDGTKFISGSWDKTVKEWDTSTGKCTKTFEIGQLIYSVCYSPDGKKLLVGGSSITSEWDFKTTAWLEDYTGNMDCIYTVCYSPAGKKILSGCRDGIIREYNVKDLLIRTYTGHEYSISSICYSPDGKRILSSSYDNNIKEWNVNTGSCIKTYTGHKSFVYSVCYNHDGKKILSGSEDKTIKEWNTDTGKCIRTFTEHKGPVYSVHYSINREKLLSASKDRTIREWSVITGEYNRAFEVSEDAPVFCIFYQKGNNRFLLGGYDKTIKEWDVNTGKCIKIYTGHTGEIYSIYHSPNENKFISGSSDKTIKEWDMNTGECINTYAGHNGDVYSVCYNSNEKKIISGSSDKTIKEWSVETGKCINTYEGHDGYIYSVCYNRNGEKILSGSSDKTIKEWSVEIGKCINIYNGHNGSIYSVCYSHDGLNILSGSSDQTVKEWSVGTGKCINTYEGHDGSICSACYSRTGKEILSGSSDKTIKEWNVKTGKCINTYKGHSGIVRGAVYIQDEKNILSGSTDNSVKLWKVDTGECIRTIKNMTGVLIQGVDMKNLPDGVKFTQEEKEILKQYGAILD